MEHDRADADDFPLRPKSTNPVTFGSDVAERADRPLCAVTFARLLGQRDGRCWILGRCPFDPPERADLAGLHEREAEYLPFLAGWEGHGDGEGSVLVGCKGPTAPRDGGGLRVECSDPPLFGGRNWIRNLARDANSDSDGGRGTTSVFNDERNFPSSPSRDLRHVGPTVRICVRSDQRCAEEGDNDKTTKHPPSLAPPIS
jgi:hypothetical protein